MSMGPEAVVVEPNEHKALVWKSLKDTLFLYDGICEGTVGAMMMEIQTNYSSL